MKKPSKVQQEYWEGMLKRYGLTADAGRVNWLEYGHRVLDLDYDGRIAYRPKTGESLDGNEWPQSLC
jgi:hypothetical protein